MMPHKASFGGQTAWEEFGQTAKVTRLLRIGVLLLQCLSSFRLSKENEATLRDFLKGLDDNGFMLVWKPQGKWREALERIAELCREVPLIHYTYPFDNHRYREQDFLLLKAKLDERESPRDTRSSATRAHVRLHWPSGGCGRGNARGTCVSVLRL